MKNLEVAIIAMALAAVSVDASADLASWKFLQSVGGLTVGEPQRDATGWVLPIHADVSGLTSPSVQPTNLNSGIACLETRASVANSTVSLSIVTGVAGAGRNARCPAASLGHLVPGRYSVVYRADGEAQVSLGSIVIAP